MITGQGSRAEIQRADYGFKNPRLEQGVLVIHSPDQISFESDGAEPLFFSRQSVERATDAVFAGQPSLSDVVARVEQSIVYIRTSSGEGSGFSLGGMVVTNFHVVAGESEIIVLDSTGADFLVTSVLAFDEERDLALLEIPAWVPEVTFAKTLPRPGDDVLVLGYPAGATLGIDTATVTKGILSAIRAGYLQFDAAISPGSSGGAVLNSKGEVWGVTVAKHAVAESVSFGIPSHALLALFENPRPMTPTDFARATRGN